MYLEFKTVQSQWMLLIGPPHQFQTNPEVLCVNRSKTGRRLFNNTNSCDVSTSQVWLVKTISRPVHGQTMDSHI
jgi:hypothetical protein